MRASNDRAIDPRIKDFRIYHAPNLYTDKYYLPSYRLILLHAFYIDVKHHDTDASLLSLAEGLLKVADNFEPSFYKQKCIEAYTFSKDGKSGIFLVDRTKGCYPLVLYPKDLKPVHGERDSAFKMVLLDIKNQSQFFESTTKSSPSWNQSLVDSLESKFVYSEKKAA